MQVKLVACGAVLVALFASAELRFILATPIIESVFLRTEADPGGRFNLAQAALGLTVRASSADWSSDSHPAYALHGHSDSSLKSWASMARDRAPWIEVEFDRPRRVDEIVMRAWCTDPPISPSRRYAVACFAGDRVIGTRDGDDQDLAGDGRELKCIGATRVQVTFARDPAHPRNVARLCEFEVWGS